MYCDALIEYRGYCHNLMKSRRESLIKQWLSKFNYTKPVGYYLDTVNNVMEIYTHDPGVLIGEFGSNITDLEKMLKDEFSWTDWKVKLIEVRGGFIIPEQGNN